MRVIDWFSPYSGKKVDMAAWVMVFWLWLAFNIPPITPSGRGLSHHDQKRKLASTIPGTHMTKLFTSLKDCFPVIYASLFVSVSY